MIRDSKPARRLITAAIMGLLMLCIGPLSIVSAASTAVAADAIIKVNGEKVKMSGSEAFVFLNRMYVPAARIAEAFGAKASWDNDNEELTLHTALGDDIVLGNGVPVVYFNEERYRMDAYPFVKNGRLFIPLRQLADLLHADMNTNETADVINLTAVKPAVVTEAYGLDEISADFGIGKSMLLKRNGLSGNAVIKPGTKLKVAIPSFFDQAAKPYTEADYLLLAKITMVESGYESYAGQLALANVILNRVKDPRFPDSVRDVIYSGRQFPPAHNGLLDRSKPNATALRAAKDALNGRNNIKNAVYFFNPDISTGSYWSSLDVVATIGHHRFAR
ncbi:cell wall hydrolase [Paenibacillus rhizovicinus]|uniref:Cell wall hydrolase n=1 Tax=Paenibacillus rhizovicinus TaxID=2704463 RepID=A0A6C0PBK3_9BACL|nr:cell wall hydrolase [Paenibacillus rhizovicinus]QHW33982.1 cell wall hydrolase [Paenibacillus rhizovicinus]